MTPVADNGIETATASIQETKTVEGSQAPSMAVPLPYMPPKRKRNPLKENGTLLIIAAVIVILLVAVAFESLSKYTSGSATSKPKDNQPSKYMSRTSLSAERPTPTDTLIPATNTPHSANQQDEASQIGPEQIARTAKVRVAPSTAPSTAGTLGAIPPFDGSTWQPAPYQASSVTGPPVTEKPAASTRNERDELDKSSLVFVRNNSQAAERQPSTNEIEIGLGMAPGTRLRARLESAISSAVQAPVVAVIEYNYEQQGEIVVPAGAKALGRLQSAGRSGYIGVQFDSLMMPDGSTVKLQAAATDLQLAPLKGRVQGKNTGKNVIIRSLSGVGEVAATIVGQGGFNQPLSEQDLLRERIATNIGQSSDQEVSNLAITERIVVTVPANTEIYVVLEKPAQATATGGTIANAQSASKPPSVEDLRQLLQLQRELNTPAATSSQ